MQHEDNLVCILKATESLLPNPKPCF